MLRFTLDQTGVHFWDTLYIVPVKGIKTFTMIQSTSCDQKKNAKSLVKRVPECAYIRQVREYLTKEIPKIDALRNIKFGKYFMAIYSSSHESKQINIKNCKHLEKWEK